MQAEWLSHSKSRRLPRLHPLNFMLSQLPPPIVNSRRNACRCECPVDFGDPCASCPKKRWGPNMCVPHIDEIEAEQTLQQDHQVSFPNVPTLALNLASAVGAEVKSRFLGNNQLDLDEIKRRLAICEGCEFFHSPSQRCKKCGCFLKWKTAWRSQKCPVGKW